LDDLISFAPHRFWRVACNEKGTIVAATMGDETVFILRGRSDGTVLATRHPDFFFVSGEYSDHEYTMVIAPPEEGPPIMVSNMNGWMASL
jgi:hypothetical protein